MFLISVPDLFSDLGKTDYIGPHQLIPNEPVSNQPIAMKPGPMLPAAFPASARLRYACRPYLPALRRTEPESRPGIRSSCLCRFQSIGTEPDSFADASSQTQRELHPLDAGSTIS